MTHARHYKAARSPQEAIEELLRCSGTHFDPDVVVALIDEAMSVEPSGALQLLI